MADMMAFPDTVEECKTECDYVVSAEREDGWSEKRL